MNKSYRTLLASLLALCVVSSTAGAAGAATLAFNDSDAEVPNPTIKTDVTKDVHDLDKHSSLLEYENNNGELVTLPASVNTSADNPVTFTATDVEDNDLGYIPSDYTTTDNASYTTNASKWSDDYGDTANLSVSDTKTAPGTDAVTVEYTGDTEAATVFNDVDINEDAKKRTLTVAMDVAGLEDSDPGEVKIEVYDADGDVKRLNANQTADASEPHVITNTSGEGKLHQIQLGKLDTKGAGDGNFGDVDRIKVIQYSGDVEVDISALNVHRTDAVTFGERMAHADSDGAKEPVAVTSADGPISVTGVSSVGDVLSDARIHGITFAIEAAASDLGESDIDVQSNATDKYPGFDQVVDLHYRLTLPSAYDLSYENTRMVTEQKWPSERYLSVEYAEGVGETEFENVNYGDVTGDFQSEGQTVTLDSSISEGDSLAVHFELKFTNDEYDTLTGSESSSIGPVGQSDSGFGDLPIIGGIAAALAALFARFRGMI